MNTGLIHFQSILTTPGIRANLRLPCRSHKISRKELGIMFQHSDSLFSKNLKSSSLTFCFLSLFKTIDSCCGSVRFWGSKREAGFPALGPNHFFLEFRRSCGQRDWEAIASAIILFYWNCNVHLAACQEIWSTKLWSLVSTIIFTVEFPLSQ